MSDIIRCTACKGQKKFMGLGLMEQTCDACKGVGYIEINNNVAVNDEQLAVNEVTPITKKPEKKKK